MDILLKELNERYYYGECLNNGSLSAIEKVKELMNYNQSILDLIEAIDKEEKAFKAVNNSITKYTDIYIKGYILELGFIKKRALELNAA